MIPVSVTVPQFNQDSAPLLDLARNPGGIAGVFVFDHLVPLDDPHRPVLEAASTLGALAAAARGRIGSLVLRATMRPPEVTGAIARTLATIAPGRVVVGLGVGDRLTSDETNRFGMPTGGFESRLEELRETIAVIREWAPGVTVWVGGRHQRVRAIAAELADGWNCWNASPAEFEAEAADVRGRADRRLTVSWGGTVLLATDPGQLEDLITRRGGTDGAIAGDGAKIGLRLEELAAVADELVVSLVPNRRPSWDLLSELIA